jgi:hypothetical protein
MTDHYALHTDPAARSRYLPNHNIPKCELLQPLSTYGRIVLYTQIDRSGAQQPVSTFSGSAHNLRRPLAIRADTRHHTMQRPHRIGELCHNRHVQ